jgi:hypothetical protein
MNPDIRINTGSATTLQCPVYSANASEAQESADTALSVFTESHARRTNCRQTSRIAPDGAGVCSAKLSTSPLANTGTLRIADIDISPRRASGINRQVSASTYTASGNCELQKWLLPLASGDSVFW